MSKPFHVLIIGGGIIGSATAYYLAKRGLSVAVVEKGRIAGEQFVGGALPEADDLVRAFGKNERKTGVWHARSCMVSSRESSTESVMIRASGIGSRGGAPSKLTTGEDGGRSSRENRTLRNYTSRGTIHCKYPITWAFRV